MKHHKDEELPESALRVNAGVEQPPIINAKGAADFKKTKKAELSVNDYVVGIKEGSRAVLSKAITIVESALPTHTTIAQQVIAECLPFSGNSIRIGITGVPGVGKSTFIESFGKYLTGKGHKVAILAIDPSSNKSKGSILGDKTRMELLSSDPNAFIRPSPSSGTLGGVARKTHETIILCEAAGYDVILIETVGVGQSEVLVHSMADFFLLLMLAGAGDELQGIKRGIMEMADGVFITKDDGDNVNRVHLALAEVRNALHFLAPSESGWNPPATSGSAITGKGITEIWQMITDYMNLTKSNGFFYNKRTEQKISVMRREIEQGLLDEFYINSQMKTELLKMENELHRSKISSYVAAQQILEKFRKQRK